MQNSLVDEQSIDLIVKIEIGLTIGDDQVEDVKFVIVVMLVTVAAHSIVTDENYQ